MATGVLDLLYAFHSRQLVAISQDGFLGAVEPDVAFSTFEKETAFWHMMFWLMASILGGLVHWPQAGTGEFHWRSMIVCTNVAAVGLWRATWV
jgi:hypothetical protein